MWPAQFPCRDKVSTLPLVSQHCWVSFFFFFFFFVDGGGTGV
jgi:hypothetical protein